MSNVEQTATPKRRSSGLSNKPRSTFNPMKTATPPKTDAEIASAYRAAVDVLQPEKFDLSDEQIVVVVRSHSGVSSEEIEGLRINALLKATGVEHKAPDVSAASSVANHHAEAVQAAADFPAAALRTLRRLTEAGEVNQIGALVLRQNLLDDPKKGKEWLRNFRRIGAKEGVKGDDGILHNFCEYYKEDYKDKNGVDRTKFHSFVADVVNETDDGKMQQEQIALYSKAVSDKGFAAETFPNADDKTLNDGLAKWRKRNKTSIDATRTAIRIEQLMADLERSAPNVVVQIKYKVDAKGEKTNELRNSARPIIMANKNDLTGTTELSIRDFVRLKVTKAQASVPEAKKEAGPNVMLLKATIERQAGTPNKGQGKVEAVAGSTRGKLMITAREVIDVLTLQLAHYFDRGDNTQQRREGDKRIADLIAVLSPKSAQEDVLAVGDVLGELNNWFSGTFGTRYAKLVEARANAENGDKEADAA